jgi:hypothetical protein
MIGAIVTAGRIDGGPVNLGLAPALLAVMILLLWTGAGRWSLDGRIVSRGGRWAATAGAVPVDGAQ